MMTRGAENLRPVASTEQRLTDPGHSLYHGQYTSADYAMRCSQQTVL